MLRASIVGCGQIAGDYDRELPVKTTLTHAGAYRLCPGTELIAVVDSDSARAESFAERWGVKRFYTDLKRMLLEEKPDIVSLCLPAPFHHGAFSTVCAESRAALFCEKPLADSPKEALEMVRLARGRTVAVNFFRRWNRDLGKLRADFTEGRHGKPLQAVARYTKGLKGNGSHLIDLMRWFFGEPETVERIRVSRRHPDPGVDFRMIFPDGLEAVFLHVPDVDYVFIDLDILTDAGRVVIEQRGQGIASYRTEPDPAYPFNVLRRASESVTDWNGCLLSAVEDLVDCMKSGREPRCTINDGMRAVEICHQLTTE